MSKFVYLKILNFKKYNPRPDVEKSTWFRLEQNLFGDPAFCELDTGEEIAALVYILCEASKGQGDAKIYLPHLLKYGRTTEPAFKTAVAKLEASGFLAVHDGTQCYEPELDVTSRNGPFASGRDGCTNERTNERTDERIAPKSAARGKAPPDVGALEMLNGSETLTQLLSSVKQSTQRLWIERYQDTDWLRDEFRAAAIWLEANPRRRPRDYGKFLSNWLERGWERHRKTIPSSPPKKPFFAKGPEELP